VNKVRHFASERCPVTRLTKLQVCALASACIETSKNIPNRVYRSLVIRGLLASAHTLTSDGREALANCKILSNHFHRSLLAMSRADATQLTRRQAACCQHRLHRDKDSDKRQHAAIESFAKALLKRNPEKICSP